MDKQVKDFFENNKDANIWYGQVLTEIHHHFNACSEALTSKQDEPAPITLTRNAALAGYLTSFVEYLESTFLVAPADFQEKLRQIKQNTAEKVVFISPNSNIVKAENDEPPAVG